MTCVSLRSGIASSGTFRIDQMPATTAKPTRMKTMSRLRPENSMMWLIMAAARVFQLGLGVNQKGSGSDNALAGFDASDDFDTIADAVARAHLARLEIAVSAIDKDRCAQAGIDHGVCRHGHAAANADSKLDV